MPNVPPPFDLPPDLLRFAYPLPNLANKLKGGHPVTIVAIGSSSTAGEGGIPPYPGRLEAALRKRFPDCAINILNKGVGGEEAPQELARFDTDVLSSKPALVLWQVGTNAIFHREDYDFDDVAASIVTGLDRLRGRDLDVVLMDPQYVPALLKPDKIDRTVAIVSLIADAGKRANLNVFQRFALMRHWHMDNNVPLDQMIDPTDIDALHQSEWSTAGVTEALQQAITGAVASATSA